MAWFGTVYNGGQAFNEVSDLALNEQDSSTLTPTSGTCYAQYLGRAPKYLTSAVGWMYMGSTPASGVTWAEFGIATGDLPTALNGATTLTPQGFVSISADVTGGSGPFFATVSGLSIPKGTNVWALVSISTTTTQPQIRGRLPGDFHGQRASKAATRISTSVGTAVTNFVSNTANTVAAICNVRWV